MAPFTSVIVCIARQMRGRSGFGDCGVFQSLHSCSWFVLGEEHDVGASLTRRRESEPRKSKSNMPLSDRQPGLARRISAYERVDASIMKSLRHCISEIDAGPRRRFCVCLPKGRSHSWKDAHGKFCEHDRWLALAWRRCGPLSTNLNAGGNLWVCTSRPIRAP